MAKKNALIFDVCVELWCKKKKADFSAYLFIFDSNQQSHGLFSVVFV